jgi:hypothetical protein
VNLRVFGTPSGWTKKTATLGVKHPVTPATAQGRFVINFSPNQLRKQGVATGLTEGGCDAAMDALDLTARL